MRETGSPSYTISPFETVQTTFASEICLGSTSRMLRSITTRSAFLPVSIVPTMSSMKFSYATFFVYISSIW